MIVIGATPPPLHGSAFTNMHLVEAMRRRGRLAGHLETGEDDRPVFTTGRLDLANVYYGLKHVTQLIGLLLRRKRATVWVPISQNLWGFTRDGIFIWLARAARRRVIIHLNGGYFAEFYEASGPLQRWLIARTLGQVSEAWVLTEAHRSVFDGLVPPTRVRMLENTADDMAPGGLPAEADEARDGHRIRILFLAYLHPEKGYGDLLDAIDLLIERGVGGIDVRMVGEVRDEDREPLAARARAMAAHDVNLEIVGPLSGERKVAQYHWADIFTLPSRREGQPLVLLEAMSAGLPIVSTDHSGIPFTVLDEQQGLIVPPRDIEAIAAALERLISDPDLRRRLGAAGRKRYEERYRQDRFYEAVESLLADPV